MGRAGDRGHVGTSGSRRVLRRPLRRTLAAAAIAIASLTALAPGAGAELAPVSEFPLPLPAESSNGPESVFDSPEFFGEPTSSAVNSTGAGGASPGDVYVLDNGHDSNGKKVGSRIEERTSSDEFVRMWGADVVRSGPDNSNELQGVQVDATGGTFKLEFGAQATADIQATASAAQVQAALEALSSIGPNGVSVTGGPGGAGGTSPYLVSFDGSATAGKDEPQLVATPGSAPLSGGAATAAVYTIGTGGDGFEVCDPAAGDDCKRAAGGSSSFIPRLALDQSSGNVYVADEGKVTGYSAGGALLRSWGRDVVRAGPDDSGNDEVQEVTVKADGGTFKLSFSQDGEPETTPSLPYNAGAAQVESALNAFSSIGGNYSHVTVTGGPGDLSGSSPYLVTFHGLLGGDHVERLFPVSSLLTASAGTPSATVSVATAGGGFEVCGPEDLCKQAESGDQAGALGRSVAGVAVAPAGAANAGDVLVTDPQNQRVQEFGSDGHFVRLFGWDVIAPGNPGNVNTDEVDEVSIHDTVSGTFKLRFFSSENGFPTTGSIPYDATATEVQAALEALAFIGPGNVSVSGPTGGPWQITYIGSLATQDVPDLNSIGSPQPFPAGTLIGPQTITLENVTGGSFTISYAFPEACCPARSTGPIPYNATSGEVQSALEAISLIGPGGVSVSGPAAGPWQINFTTAPEYLVTPSDGALAGPAPKATRTVPRAETPTITPGAGFEVCTEATACQRGEGGPEPGKLAGLRALAEDSSGAVYTVEDAGIAGNVDLDARSRGPRVEKFIPGSGLALTPTPFGTNEVQTITVNATSGQFRLGAYEGNHFLGPSAGYAGTHGLGHATGGSKVITELSTQVGEFHTGQPVEVGNGVVPYGTYITAVGPNSLTLSHPAKSSSQFGTESVSSTRLYATSDLAHDATAAQVEAAIDILPPLTAGTEASVSVSGPAGGPFQVTFSGGRLARTDPPQLIGMQGATPLGGGSGPGANTAVIATTTPGGPGGIGGEQRAEGVDSPIGIAIGSSGHVLVSRNYLVGDQCAGGEYPPSELRVQELDSSGAVLDTTKPCLDVRPQPSVASRPTSLAGDPLSGYGYLLDPGPCCDDSRLLVIGHPGPPPSLGLNPVSDLTATSVTISGTINPHGPGEAYPAISGPPASYQSAYRLEYKKHSEAGWTPYLPNTSLGSGTSSIPFSVGVAGLEPKTEYDLRVVATKPFTPNGVVEAQQTVTTNGAPPAINAFRSTGVTASSADLHALINPRGTDTTYHFEYGTSTGYGTSTTETDIGSSLQAQDVEAHISELQDTPYHFRVVATNSFGTTVSEDQTFLFHPGNCPNQTVRQQTGSAYLPDCRAYELVTPENAGGTTFYTGGPQSPYATSPSRLAFVGGFGQVPGSGGVPINGPGDLYVATRSPTGWATRYVGLNAEQAGCVGGRPKTTPFGLPTTIQNDVFATSDLGRFADWNLGNPLECVRQLYAGAGHGDFDTAVEGSNAPYLWSAEGQSLGRWPADLETLSGAKDNFACPQDPNIHPYPPKYDDNVPVSYFCSTEVAASKDLTHFVFSTQSGLFGQGGITTAPGSAYDEDTETGARTLISVLPVSEGGGPIPQDPGSHGGPEQLIQFPHVSADGSRILMGVGSREHCRLLTFDETPCPVVDQPTHLYLRVDDTVSFDVSADSNGDGHSVTYVGSTEDGSRVYFATAIPMTADDTDNSVDLFAWDENQGSPTLTLVSAGDSPAAGNFDNCTSTWTSKCGVETYSDAEISTADANKGGLGNWTFGFGGDFEASSENHNPNPGYTDNSIAAASGDVYFYSPEQLVSGKGVPSRENVFVLHQGALQFVAALSTGTYCVDGHPIDFLQRPGRCSAGALGRLQVTPDGHYAAFVTTSRLTAYNNAGHAEMYRYNAETEQLLCISCRPDGQSPTSDVLGSMGGRFITDDGRVFFDTEDALSPGDTNQGKDTYEFVDGRPQLITSGTGNGAAGTGFTAESAPGLYGVSADGTDVYFGTFDSLVSQDHNGAGQLKFYDARSGGGFLVTPAAQPCAAADECHGEASGPPGPVNNGTGAALGSGGNLSAQPPHKSRKKRRHRRHHAHRHHHRAGRGSR